MKKIVLLILAVLLISQFTYSTNETNGLTELFKRNVIRECLNRYFTYKDLIVLFATCKEINLSIPTKELSKQKEHLLKELFVSDFKEYRKVASFDRSGLADLTLEIPMDILSSVNFHSTRDWHKKKKRRKNIESTFNIFDLNDLVNDRDSVFVTIGNEGEYHQINVENNYEKDIFNEVESNYYVPMSEEEISAYWARKGDDPHDLHFNKLKPQKFLKLKFIVNFDDKFELDYLHLFDKGFLFDEFKFSIHTNENERFTIPNTERLQSIYGNSVEFLPDVDRLEKFGLKFKFTFYEKQITTTKDDKLQINYGFTDENDKFNIHHTSVEVDLQSQLDEEKEEETNQNNSRDQMYPKNVFFNPMRITDQLSLYNTPKYPQFFQHPSQIQNPIFQQQNNIQHHPSFFQQQTQFQHHYLMNMHYLHLINSQHNTINKIPDFNQNFDEYESYISDAHGSEDNNISENEGDNNSEYDLENMSTYVFYDNEEVSELDISAYEHLSRNQSEENKSENQDDEEDNTTPEIDISVYDHENISAQQDLQKNYSPRKTKF